MPEWREPYGRLTSHPVRAVRMERTLAASPGEAWSALVEPHRLAVWLADARVDARAGGTYELRWASGDAAGGRILAFEAPTLLEYEWASEGEETSVVRIELAPTGDGTRLTLLHTLLSGDSLAGRGAGWHAGLDALAAHLVGREVDWDERFGALLPRYRDLAAGSA